MGLFTHLPLLLLLAVIMLVVFGPKRMIEMGRALWKAGQDSLAAMRDIDWSQLTRDESDVGPPQPRVFKPVQTPAPERVVEGSAEPVAQDTEPPKD